MGTKVVWILFSLLGVSHLTSGAETWVKRNSFSKYSSQVPASSSANRRVAPARESYDYTGGFPQGFSQGLPTFDFTGPMTSAGENKETHAAAETENVGFVNGPPDGFPTLEQLGGKFPNFGESVVEQPSSSKQSNSYHRHQPAYSTPSSYSTEEDDDYLSGPGPSSMDGPGHRIPVESVNGPTSSPYSRRPPPPPPAAPVIRAPSHYSPVQVSGSRPHSQYLAHISDSSPHSHYPTQVSGSSPHSTYPEVSGSSPHSSYPRPIKYHDGHSLPRYPPKKAIVLKVSEKNNKRTKPELPPGPPVFYAPSPDMQSSSHPSQDNRGASTYQAYRRAGRPIYRQKRSAVTGKLVKETKATKNEATEEPHDLKPSATESETFWELTSSPFILFDTYKNTDKEEQNTGNLSAVNGDADGGEQRFFPSFPAPAPYLVGPFGGGPQSRPPLFPGPAANRAPSRYHPQFAGTKFTPAPNRGPSGAYSAESHDHYQDNNLLGSGNFEVVRGGTYYGDDDDGYHGGGSGGNAQYHEHDDGEYYHHNGHSSPQEGYRVPGHDFFANFRDFADINPPSRSFSHRHEALAAEPRETFALASRTRQPKNILEKLENPTEERSAPSQMSKDSDPMMATF